MKTASPGWLISLIIILGLGVRLAWVLYTPALPVSDFAWYDRVAHNLAGGLGYAVSPGNPTAFRPPAYPVFLAIIYSSFKGSLLSARLVNVILGGLVIWLTYLLASRHYPPRIALLAAAMVAFIPSLILYSGLLASENLAIPLLLASMLCAEKGWQRGISVRQTVIWLITAGFLIGFAAQARSSFILLPLVWMAWYWVQHRNWRLLLRNGAVLGIGTILALLPWTIRNAVVFGHFIPLSTNSGINLLVSFNSASRGSFVTGSEIPGLQELSASGLDELAFDQRAGEMALDYIRSHPLRVAALAPLKVYQLYRDDVSGVIWNDSNPQQPLPAWLRLSLIVAAQAAYMVVMLVTLMGLLRWRVFIPDQASTFLLLPVLYLTLIHTVYFGDDRYHLPILPLLTILAAGPLLELINGLRKVKNQVLR